MLDGVDRLAVVADQKPQVVADELGMHSVLILADLDASLDRGVFGNTLEQLPDPGLGLTHLIVIAHLTSVGCSRLRASSPPWDADYRRRPERFFFLRGGGGGGPPRPRDPAPTATGSSALIRPRSRPPRPPPEPFGPCPS